MRRQRDVGTGQHRDLLASAASLWRLSRVASFGQYNYIHVVGDLLLEVVISSSSYPYTVERSDG